MAAMTAIEIDTSANPVVAGLTMSAWLTDLGVERDGVIWQIPTRQWLSVGFDIFSGNAQFVVVEQPQTDARRASQQLRRDQWFEDSVRATKLLPLYNFPISSSIWPWRVNSGRLWLRWDALFQQLEAAHADAQF